jgi:hypothetical protein
MIIVLVFCYCKQTLVFSFLHLLKMTFDMQKETNKKNKRKEGFLAWKATRAKGFTIEVGLRKAQYVGFVKQWGQAGVIAVVVRIVQWQETSKHNTRNKQATSTNTPSKPAQTYKQGNMSLYLAQCQAFWWWHYLTHDCSLKSSNYWG